MTFKERTLADAQENMSTIASPDARKEASKTDLVILEAERDRLRRRLDFWEHRHRQLTTG